MSNLPYGPLFFAGDAVYYTGDKFKEELTSKEGKPFRGWIHAPVRNEEGAFVVWFPDTKESDSYILSAGNLSKARSQKTLEKVEKGPIVEHMPVRRKKGDDE